MSNDVKENTRTFFAAYDAHNVEGMLALCADSAQGRYLPYGKNSVTPIRGGLEKIWRGFVQAVPDFGVEVDEMIQAEGNTVVVQAQLGEQHPLYATLLNNRGFLYFTMGNRTAAESDFRKALGI